MGAFFLEMTGVVGGRAQKRYTRQRYDYQTKPQYLRSSRGASREQKVSNPQTGPGRTRRHDRGGPDPGAQRSAAGAEVYTGQVPGVGQNTTGPGRGRPQLLRSRSLRLRLAPSSGEAGRAKLGRPTRLPG